MENTIASAISKGLFRQVRYLIEFGKNVNRRGEDGRTPAMLCTFIESNNWSCGLLRLLIEKGADLTKEDKNGLTVLHFACMYGREKLLKILLEAADFDLNAVDSHGNTALHYSVALGYVNITECLIKALDFYKRTLDVGNRLGVTPLIQAWKSGERECADVLIKAGANEEMRDMIYFKTAKEWEEMCTTSTSESQESLNSKNSWNRSNDNHRIRSGKRERRQINVSSDRLLTRKRPKTAIGMSSDGDIFLKLEETIKDAGPNAIRNNVRRIFDTDAIEMFDTNSPTRANNVCQMSSRSDLSRSNDSGSRAINWRMSMRKLYSALEYQCAPSFRIPAKPDLSNRPGSPQPSEMSEAVSDSMKRPQRRSGRQSVAERRRLTSASSSTSNARQRKVSSMHLSPPS